jgi:phage-related protein
MNDKPLRWLHGEIKTPPIGIEARRELGMLLRDLQQGETLGMPQSRPMPACHELRVSDCNKSWRLIYRIDPDALVILEVFEKRTNQTPQQVIDICYEESK